MQPQAPGKKKPSGLGWVVRVSRVRARNAQGRLSVRPSIAGYGAGQQIGQPLACGPSRAIGTMHT